jgi:NADPH-dependent curcumin reductase CurA
LKPEDRYRLKNYLLVVGKQIRYEGFIVKTLDEFFDVVPPLVKSGDIK